MKQEVNEAFRIVTTELLIIVTYYLASYSNNEWKRR